MGVSVAANIIDYRHDGITNGFRGSFIRRCVVNHLHQDGPPVCCLLGVMFGHIDLGSAHGNETRRQKDRGRRDVLSNQAKEARQVFSTIDHDYVVYQTQSYGLNQCPGNVINAESLLPPCSHRVHTGFLSLYLFSLTKGRGPTRCSQQPGKGSP